jgi:hypothetical protein
MTKRYQGCNQNLYIIEEHTTQWSKDNKGVFRLLYIIEEQTTQWPKDTNWVFRITDSDYPLGIFWPLCCLFFYDIQILITPLVSFGHCPVCSSMIYRFWLHLWYVLVISSSMIYRFWLHPWCLSGYQGCNQNLYIIEEQKTQWPKDTKGVIRICIS